MDDVAGLARDGEPEGVVVCAAAKEHAIAKAWIDRYPIRFEKHPFDGPTVPPAIVKAWLVASAAGKPNRWIYGVWPSIDHASGAAAGRLKNPDPGERNWVGST